jgi:hypothetical protein
MLLVHSDQIEILRRLPHSNDPFFMMFMGNENDFGEYYGIYTPVQEWQKD